jgi:hypothetical protein
LPVAFILRDEFCCHSICSPDERVARALFR